LALKRKEISGWRYGSVVEHMLNMSGSGFDPQHHRGKKNILLFVTTWMNLEDMTLSKISRKTNTVWSESYVASKKHF
jgi:hypothetical protein